MSDYKRFSTSLIARVPTIGRRVKEGLFLLLAVIAVYWFVALFTFDPNDPGWSNSSKVSQVQNSGGQAGAWLADLSFSLFGYMAYVFPLLVLLTGRQLLKNESSDEDNLAFMLSLTGGVLCLGSGTALFHMHSDAGPGQVANSGGGIIGGVLANGLSQSFGYLGSSLFYLALLLAGFTLFSGLSWFQIMDLIGRWTLDSYDWIRERVEDFHEKRTGQKARQARELIRRKDAEKKRVRKPPVIEQPEPVNEPSKRAEEERQQNLFSDLPAGKCPPLSLLNIPVNQEQGINPDILEALSRQVELKLADFNIEVQVVAVHPGPVVTRFELEPAPGIKGSQISNLSKDLARGLSVLSVRVVDVIPGKSVVGLEIPNANREMVYLGDILKSRVYDDSKSPLTLAMGKDISGHPVVTDLAKMPHLLVAGTTGSGKSVAINSMILSLLYKSSPEEVRLIMVDPKMLELSIYEGIPHLLTPVVTDMKDAATALRWCVAEMERRYRLMSAVGVRNLKGYNSKIAEAKARGEPIPDPLFTLNDAQSEGTVVIPPLEAMPHIVVIIDELADLMMIVGKKVEELIVRLAQKARAAGIHLILATQRPSVDVITGLIKANIPSRVAFQVSSKVDSRTILDEMGAEDLLGNGDMLFRGPNSRVPERVHGNFVSDDEVHAVVNYLKSHYEVEYLDDVLNENQAINGSQTIGDNGYPVEAGGEQDALYDEAVAIVVSSRRASISNLQRRLKIGYNRAARLIEDMEAAGLVSSPEHNGSREVLVPAPAEDN